MHPPLKEISFTLVIGIFICNLQLLHAQETVAYSDTTWTFDYSSVSDSVLIAKQAQVFLDSAQALSTTIYTAMPANGDYSVANRVYEKKNQWGYPTIRILGRWMKALPVWNDYIKLLYDFDAYGSDTLFRSASSPQAGMEWMWTEQSRRENTYNAKDLLIQKLVYSGEPGNWMLDLKYEHFYDNSDNDTLTLLSSWENDSWIPESRTRREFDTEGRETLRTESSWDGTAWENVRIQYHSYNMHGWILTEETGFWEFPGTWNMNHREEYLYDAKGRVIRKYQKGVAQELRPAPTHIYRFQYDDSGRRTVLIDSVFNEELAEFELDIKKYTSYGDRYYTSYGDICQGEHYEWQDSVYAESGVFEERYQTAMGDSVVKLQLVVHKTPISLEGSDETCSGDTLKFIASTSREAELFWSSSIGDFVTGEKDSVVNLSVPNEGIGELSVWAVNNSGCKSDTLRVSLNIYPTPGSFQLSGEEEVCIGMPVSIEAPENTSLSYEWKSEKGLIENGESNHIALLTLNESGTWKISAVAVSEFACSSDTASFSLSVYDVPESFSIGSEETNGFVCQGQTLVYSVPEQEDLSIEWIVSQGEILSGAGTDSLSVQWTGDYPGELFAWASNPQGCVSDTAYKRVDISVCDGVGDIPSSTINIYPVPVRDHLIIESSEPYEKVELLDMQGIVTLSLSGVSNGLDLSSLPDGLYVLKIFGAGDVFLGTKMLIKSN